MTTLYFLCAETLTVSFPIKQRNQIDEAIHSHLHLSLPERYRIYLYPHSELPHSFHVFVDDIIQCYYLSSKIIQRFPTCVDPHQNDRTIWINPPLFDKDDTSSAKTIMDASKHYYLEYFQDYKTKTISDRHVWVSMSFGNFDELQMNNPTPLALERYKYLQSLLDHPQEIKEKQMIYRNKIEDEEGKDEDKDEDDNYVE